MKILAIGAHPDDIEFGCAGSLARYTERGDEVYLLVVADGGMGGDPQIRHKEQEISAEILGAKKLLRGGYQDTLIIFDKPLIDLLEGFLQEIEPALVLASYPDDTHQDHVRLAVGMVGVAEEPEWEAVPAQEPVGSLARALHERVHPLDEHVQVLGVLGQAAGDEGELDVARGLPHDILGLAGEPCHALGGAVAGRPLRVAEEGLEDLPVHRVSESRRAALGGAKTHHDDCQRQCELPHVLASVV